MPSSSPSPGSFASGGRIGSPNDWIPSASYPRAGQGVMGIECRSGDERVRSIIAPLHDGKAAAEVAAERAMNRRLGGGCQMPIGAFAQSAGSELRMAGLVARPDGTRVLRERRTGPACAPESLGVAVAEGLLAQGAGDIIAEVASGA